MKNTNIILPAALSLLVSGCASVYSIEGPTPEKGDGLTYYMPRRDFVVTINVTKADGKEAVISSIAAGTTEPYPDLQERYVLQYGYNALAKNVLDVTIGTNGLLTTAKGTSTSKVNEILTQLAGLGAIGKLQVMSQEPSAKDGPCSVAGSHTFVTSKLEERQELCAGLFVHISRVGEIGKDQAIASGEEPSRAKRAHQHRRDGNAVPGVFYRQNRPYRVVIDGRGLHAESIVLSPSESPIGFLPIARSFFADNKSDFVFVDGVPQKFNQDTDSEVLALLKLPASVISAYFGALGTMFASFTAVDNSESTALMSDLKLQLAERKYKDCLEAIKANDQVTVEKLGCGK